MLIPKQGSIFLRMPRLWSGNSLIKTMNWGRVYAISIGQSLGNRAEFMELPGNSFQFLKKYRPLEWGTQDRQLNR